MTINAENWLDKKIPNTTEGVAKIEFSLIENWIPSLKVRQSLINDYNIDAKTQIAYLVNFITQYLKKPHMTRTKKEWNSYFSEYCVNQEIIKFNEAGNSPFCAHDISSNNKHTHE